MTRYAVRVALDFGTDGHIRELPIEVAARENLQDVIDRAIGHILFTAKGPLGLNACHYQILHVRPDTYPTPGTYWAMVEAKA